MKKPVQNGCVDYEQMKPRSVNNGAIRSSKTTIAIFALAFAALKCTISRWRNTPFDASIDRLTPSNRQNINQQDIVSLIQEAIEEVAPGKGENVDPNNLNMTIRDAGIDSVASMEMAGVIEEELGVTFADEDLNAVQSFADLVKMIQKSQR